MLAYLKLIQIQETKLTLHIINTPKCGIGKTSLLKLIACSHKKGISSFQLMKIARSLDGFPADEAASIEVFKSIINDY